MSFINRRFVNRIVGRRRRRRRRAAGRAVGRRRFGRRSTVERAQSAVAPSVAEHHVAEDTARHTGETAALPVLPAHPDGNGAEHAAHPYRRPQHTKRVLAATLPGVHVQQSHRLFLQTTRR